MASAEQIAAWRAGLEKNLSHNKKGKSKNKSLKLWPQNFVIGPWCCAYQDTQGIPTDINFNLDENSTVLTFSLTYNGEFIGGEIHFNNLSKPNINSVNLSISAKKVDNNTVVESTNDNVSIQFIIKDFTDLNTILSVELRDKTQQTESNICDFVNSTLKKMLPKNDVKLEFRIFSQTDQFGVNLGEFGGYVTANKEYPNGIPKELIGSCDNSQVVKNLGIQTFYSFKPKLWKVLKGEGSTLLAQTNDINSIYDTNLDDCKFFFNILIYCTLRYMLAGLSNNGDFSRNWLCSNNYKKFLKNLKCSEFSDAVVLFTEPQPCFDFTNFNIYFKACDHK